MEKELAEIVRHNGLEAVKSLSTILQRAQGRCSPEEFEVLRKGVGLAIGRIQMEILEVVNREYPELDDLK